MHGDLGRCDPIDSVGMRCGLMAWRERITNHTLALSDARWRPSSAASLGPDVFSFFQHNGSAVVRRDLFTISMDIQGRFLVMGANGGYAGLPDLAFHPQSTRV